MQSEIDRIRAALGYIPVGGHDKRVRIAFMLKSELGDSGRDLWDKWRGDRGNDEADAVWRSASADGGLTIGSLFYEAKNNGWNDHEDPSNRLPVISTPTRPKQGISLREEREIVQERSAAAKRAGQILKKAVNAQKDHPYLQRKKVAPVPTLFEISASAARTIIGYSPSAREDRLLGRLLVVPIRQGEIISSLEFIDGKGRKAALVGRGTKAAGYWATEQLPDGDGAGVTLLIGEGVATVLSSAQASQTLGVAALSSGNLSAVSRVMRERYPAAELIVLADLDKASGAPDPAAVDAAFSVAGRLAIPDFGDGREAGETDFNDLSVRHGDKAVLRSLEAAAVPTNSTNSKNSSSNSPESHWFDPQPLVARIYPEPYPLDALPDPIRAAIEEVAGFVKAPISLVASSALAALSLACQAHVDVKRAENLQGPTGLFLLTIADSGERKSTCDGFFTKEIRRYQDEQAEVLKPAMKDFQAKLSAWEAEREGILSAIKSGARAGKSVQKLRDDLAQLEHEKPESPKVPRLILGDETPENLAWSLATKWPSSGVLSSEAGVVFGSHGMSKDNAMRNLALLNILWDGGSHDIGRRTSESFTVRRARLTMGLMVQEATLREYFGRSGVLARGTGFLARFLVAWPESTQGKRKFTESPENWPHLAAFNRRIAAILEQPLPVNEFGELKPTMTSFAPEAKALWVKFHDVVETELAVGGELYDVRDVAAKAADNAARLAALFQRFNSHGDNAIRSESFEAASMIVTWYLMESRRFFGELAIPTEISDAYRLDAWLVDYCRRQGCRSVAKNDVRQYGPLRDGHRLDKAIVELADLERLRLHVTDRRKVIELNPALLGEPA